MGHTGAGDGSQGLPSHQEHPVTFPCRSHALREEGGLILLSEVIISTLRLFCDHIFCSHLKQPFGSCEVGRVR